jgi:hypothetical protein
MKMKKIHWVGITLVLAVLGLSGLLPSYSYVAVSGPDGDIRVQNAGPGGIHVQTGNADIRVNHP